jgi:hypothetical protein
MYEIPTAIDSNADPMRLSVSIWTIIDQTLCNNKWISCLWYYFTIGINSLREYARPIEQRAVQFFAWQMLTDGREKCRWRLRWLTFPELFNRSELTDVEKGQIRWVRRTWRAVQYVGLERKIHNKKWGFRSPPALRGKHFADQADERHCVLDKSYTFLEEQQFCESLPDSRQLASSVSRSEPFIAAFGHSFSGREPNSSVHDQ